MADQTFIDSIPAADMARLVQLARNVARKMCPHDPDQAESDGLYGLAKALRSYDPNADASLATYATHRIRGEVLDGQRDRDHLSRAMRQKAKADGADSNPLLNPPVSLEAIQIEVPHFDIPDPGYDLDEILADKVTKRRVGACLTLIEFLVSPRDAEMVRRVLLEGWTLTEAGAVHGLTESRVSQIVTRTIARVREHLGVEVQGYSRNKNQRATNHASNAVTSTIDAGVAA